MLARRRPLVLLKCLGPSLPRSVQLPLSATALSSTFEKTQPPFWRGFSEWLPAFPLRSLALPELPYRLFARGPRKMRLVSSEQIRSRPALASERLRSRRLHDGRARLSIPFHRRRASFSEANSAPATVVHLVGYHTVAGA